MLEQTTASGSTLPRVVKGFSLIELMVAMVVALIGTIVIFQVLAVSESYKRTTTGGSDALQSGGFAAYTLERYIRMGGAGFATVPGVWGCPLGIFRGPPPAVQLFGQDTAPYHTATALPAPFETALDFRLTMAPAMIKAGATADASDTIVVMAGNHATMGRYFWVQGQTPTSISLLDNVVVGVNNSRDALGTAQHDLLLAVDQDPSAGRGTSTTCDLAEVLNAPAAIAPFTITAPITLKDGTEIFTGSDAFSNAGSYYSKSLNVANLGPVAANPAFGSGPNFTAFAVGNDGQTPNALLALNLITGYDPAVPKWVTQSLADNIVTIKAVYGVAADVATPNVDSWEAPTGTWSAATLSANPTNIQRLRAVRIAIIARNAQPEKKADASVPATEGGFSPPSFALFGGTTAAMTVTNPDRRFRYKIFDVTIPLRSMVLMTQNP